jgi:hypothetical protein
MTLNNNYIYSFKPSTATRITSYIDTSRAPATQTPITENTRQKRIEERQSLKRIPFENLDVTQDYANPGEAVPIIFARRENNKGGTWVSPALIDSASSNFDQTFVYLLSIGNMGIPLGIEDIFFGKYNLKDLDRAGKLVTPLIFSKAYTSNSTVCPVSAYSVTCTHNVFKLLLDPLSSEVGSTVQFRSIDDYSTEARILVKAIYPPGSASPTPMETYVVGIQRVNNSTGSITSVGTITTSSLGATSSLFTDTYSTGSYTHIFTVQSIAAAQTLKPEYILIEFRQENAFPVSLDRKTSYTDLTLLVVQGNLFDTSRFISAPSELKQLHIFVENGIEVEKWRYSSGQIGVGTFTLTTASSNKLGDLLLYYILESGKFPDSSNVQTLSYADVATTAIFHEYNDMLFNGVISNNTNFMSYAQSIAPMFLCSFFYEGDIFRLLPLLPLASNGAIDTAALTPVQTFGESTNTADDLTCSIIDGSYSKTYFSTDDRTPFQVLVSFRKLRKSGIETVTTAAVRYSDYSLSVIEEQYDMTEFCTREAHAILFAKYLLATRRYSTHKVSFQTAQNIVEPTDLTILNLIAVQLQRTNSAGDSRTETTHYLVDSIEFSETGITTITGTHFPLNESTASIISNSIVSGSFEVIV